MHSSTATGRHISSAETIDSTHIALTIPTEDWHGHGSFLNHATDRALILVHALSLLLALPERKQLDKPTIGRRSDTP